MSLEADRAKLVDLRRLEASTTFAGERDNAKRMADRLEAKIRAVEPPRRPPAPPAPLPRPTAPFRPPRPPAPPKPPARSTPGFGQGMADDAEIQGYRPAPAPPRPAAPIPDIYAEAERRRRPLGRKPRPPVARPATSFYGDFEEAVGPDSWRGVHFDSTD